MTYQRCTRHNVYMVSDAPDIVFFQIWSESGMQLDNKNHYPTGASLQCKNFVKQNTIDLSHNNIKCRFKMLHKIHDIYLSYNDMK